ncbi:PREDICTED: uncharacterized protein LOC104596643 [Nelumbo nucifera]|uniref:Uncharacterized protein LOC104596643 n=2 Tax=Nelumbo nucifera TaxID=4432 RepID=A0A1U8A4J5_NELNU|nr:PREDICTED: uncharacterized protein LOC104596643 [Nelumbo nucifera]DAD19425.1 TPA_asm: hypothetical protein HUJ06_020888 [Nelumbo nucifera]
MEAVRLFITVFLVLIAKIISVPPPPHPLCISEIALVSNACAFVPIEHHLTQLTATRTTHRGNQEELVNEQQRQQEHDNEDDRQEGHRRRNYHHDGPSEECCRWLREVDSMCVCQLFVPMPTFLRRPLHSYTIMVDHTCKVVFKCPQQLV